MFNSSVTNISLRVSEAGPKLSDCNEKENKKSPELCARQEPIVDQKIPLESTVEVIDDVEMAEVKDADVKEVTDEAVNDCANEDVPPPTTYAVSDAIEIMEVSVEDAVNEGSSVEATLPEKIISQEPPQKLPKISQKSNTQIEVASENHKDKEKGALIVNGSPGANSVKPESPENSAAANQEPIVLANEQIPDQTTDKKDQQQTNSGCQNGDDSNLKKKTVVQPQTNRKVESQEKRDGASQPKESVDQAKEKEPAASTSEKPTSKKRKASSSSSVDGDLQRPAKR